MGNRTIGAAIKDKANHPALAKAMWDDKYVMKWDDNPSAAAKECIVILSRRITAIERELAKRKK